MVRGKKLVGKPLLDELSLAFRDPRNYAPKFRDISKKLNIHLSTVTKHFSETFDSLRDEFIFNEQSFVVDGDDLGCFVTLMSNNSHKIVSVSVQKDHKFVVTVRFLSSTNRVLTETYK